MIGSGGRVHGLVAFPAFCGRSAIKGTPSEHLGQSIWRDSMTYLDEVDMTSAEFDALICPFNLLVFFGPGCILAV